MPTPRPASFTKRIAASADAAAARLASACTASIAASSAYTEGSIGIDEVADEIGGFRRTLAAAPAGAAAAAAASTEAAALATPPAAASVGIVSPRALASCDNLRSFSRISAARSFAASSMG